MKEKALWSVAAVLVLAQTALVAAYLSAESTVFFWDHAMYIGMARQYFGLWQNGLVAAMKALHASFSNNYSLLFTLPALAGFSLVDASRETFIISNFFVWFLLFEGAVAFALRRGLLFSWPLAISASLGGFLLVPIAWVPLLQGYPDAAAGAALMTAFAWIISPTRKISDAIKIGVALALAVLLRRHFAYGGLALIGTAGLFDVWGLVREKKETQRAVFLRLVAFYSVIGGAALGVIGVIATDFLINTLTINYSDLYNSYRKPPTDFLMHALTSFGFVPVAASVGGLVFLARQKQAVYQRLGAFTLTWTALWLVLWCGGPIQLGPHYMQQVLVPAAVLGLAAGLCALKQKPSARAWIGLGFLLMLFNSAWCLALAPSEVKQDPLQPPSLWAAAHAPMQREDLRELTRLAKTLETTTTDEERIVILGSSVVFNQDILRAIYTDYMGSVAGYLRVLPTPEIDGVQDAPFDLIASGSVYVVPEPAQYHLDPDGQRVQGALAQFFPPKDELSKYFVADPDVFVLEKGIMVRLWRKKAELPPAMVHDMAQKMRVFMGDHKTADAALTREWIFTKFALNAVGATREDNGASHAQGWFNPFHTTQHLLLNRPLTAGAYRLSAFLMSSPECTNGFGLWRVVDGKGKVLATKDFSQKNVGGFEQEIVVPKLQGEAFLELRLGVKFAAGAGRPCWVVLNNLALK